jgi:hypothetical protein
MYNYFKKKLKQQKKFKKQKDNQYQLLKFVLLRESFRRIEGKQMNNIILFMYICATYYIVYLPTR